MVNCLHHGELVLPPRELDVKQSGRCRLISFLLLLQVPEFGLAFALPAVAALLQIDRESHKNEEPPLWNPLLGSVTRSLPLGKHAHTHTHTC